MKTGKRFYHSIWLALMLLGCAMLAYAATFAIYPQATGEKAYNNGGATLDASHTDQGYVMVKKSSNKKLKVRITGVNQYTYDLTGNGEFQVYPLQDGSGKYSVVVYEQVQGNSYAQVLSKSLDVTLVDENAAFLGPNRYAWYGPDSEIVKLGAEICAELSTDREKADAAYQYIVSNITYDFMEAILATSGQISGYVPDLDEVLSTKMGICFDISAMMCAILRSQGIPTQMIMGHADTTYHAWNKVLLDGEWVQYDATAAVTFSQIKQYTEEAVY